MTAISAGSGTAWSTVHLEILKTNRQLESRAETSFEPKYKYIYVAPCCWWVGLQGGIYYLGLRVWSLLSSLMIIKHQASSSPGSSSGSTHYYIFITLIDVRVHAEASDKTGYLINCSQGMIVKHLDIWKWVCLCTLYWWTGFLLAVNDQCLGCCGPD